MKKLIQLLLEEDNIDQELDQEKDTPDTDIEVVPEPRKQAPPIPLQKITPEEAERLIYGTKGKYFVVSVIKKDGTERIMRAALGVKKYLRGGVLPYDPKQYGYVIVYDYIAKGYRALNTNTITRLKIGNNNYTVMGSVAESERDEMLNELLQKRLLRK